MPILNMIAQGSGGGGGNIGEPLNLTVTTSGLDATIKWEDNEIGTIPPTTFQKSELVRKIGSAPTSPSDGVLVVTETVKDTYKVSGYVDSGLTGGTTYYYRVFSYSDLGGISYCDAVSVTPSGGGWQPGVNTLAYRPVDGDMKDYSGNGYDLQGSPTSYETLLSGLKVGVFDGNVNPRPGNIYPNTAPILQVTQHNTNNFTVSFWINVVTFTSDTGIMYVQGTGSYQVFYWGVNTNIFRFGLGNGAGSNFAYKDFNTTNSANTWYHIVFVYDYNSGSPYIKCYKDNVLLDTISTNAFNNWNAWDCGTIMYSHYDNSCKKISRWIIEDKARTAQEVADYYNQTKSLYGIS